MERQAVALVAAVTAAAVTSLAAIAGVGWLVVGHPGVDGAPELTATRAEFCGAFSSLFGPTLAAIDAGEEVDQDVSEMYGDYARRVEAVGLPVGAPRRVWDGYEVFVEHGQRLPAGDLSDAELVSAIEISAADDEAYRRFDLWARRTCRLPR